MDSVEQAAWLHALIKAVDVGVHAVDEAGMTIYYNERAGSLDGLDPSEVRGRHVLDVFPSLTEETSTLLRVLRSRETISHQRQSYRNYRGIEVHTTNTTRPVYADDRLIGALEVAADITEVQHLAQRVMDLQAAHMAPAKPRAKAQGTTAYTLEDMVTGSPALQAVIDRARKIARTSSPVLVYGETGVGKELLVQGIHAASPRSTAPFIAQNCAALPGPLLEGILFGTVKGSFTGAETRPGLFELAHGGTLFLDELNSLGLDLQAKLLRVLEDGQIRRLGDQRVIPVNVRVIAAMNEEPETVVSKGLLREDLYYRVQVVTLHIPPLAKRPEDILPLAHHFIRIYNDRFGLHCQGLTNRAQDALQRASWRGNVRELKHAIEAALNEAEGPLIDVYDLPARVWPQDSPEPSAESADRKGESLPERMARIERAAIQEALQQSGASISRAAILLGIPRQTLQSKIKKYALSEDERLEP
ncbi:MAG: sigma 54-interacting transcriptional regulator [Firmicutes bacterium]|nr:sigma 54-interacting transcriptional regulator [Bacillota bacterium]